MLLVHFCALFVTSVRAINTTEIFQRPIITRIYVSEQYALANDDRATGDRVDISTVASSLAGLRPSYVNSLVYLSYGSNLTDTMINDFNTVRSVVLAASPNARFDVEISIDPQPINNKEPFPNAAAITSFMTEIDAKLNLDGWWFDFYSSAQSQQPEWIVAITEYARSRNQTVGGNVFDNTIPPSADAVAFVDKPDNSTVFGFSINAKEVAALKQNTSSTIILGHLNCNPQNGNTTESCVYMYDWNSTQRVEYFNYWIGQQAVQGFTYMFPQFFPLCPGAYSFDPLNDVIPSKYVPSDLATGHNMTFYDYIQAVVLGNSSTTAAATATSGGISSTTSIANTTHTSGSSAQFSAQGLSALAWAGVFVVNIVSLLAM